MVDLSRLKFMDGSGVRALIEVVGAVGPDGRPTIRRRWPPRRRVLALVRADRFPGIVIFGL
jgi:anti-anti-sigma regulatory factor